MNDTNTRNAHRPPAHLWRATSLLCTCVSLAICAPAIRYTPNLFTIEGRTETPTDGELLFDWPGTTIRFTCTATACTVFIEGEAQFNLTINDFPAGIITSTRDGGDIELFTGAAPRTARVTLTLRTRAQSGPVRFFGVSLNAEGVMLPPPPPLPQTLVILGGSQAMGLGNEGASGPCPRIYDLSNIDLSFGALLARRAKLSPLFLTTCGRGVMRTWAYRGPAVPRNLLGIYDRVALHDSTRHVHSTDTNVVAVIIHQGNNDFSTMPHPWPGVFVARYQALLHQCAARFPHAALICLAPPRAVLNGLINQAVDELAEVLPVEIVNLPDLPRRMRGCDWHYNEQGHQAVADRIYPLLRRSLPKR